MRLTSGSTLPGTIVALRPIGPDAHGAIDYTTVADLLFLSRALPVPQRVRRLLQTSALFSLVYSLLTRYRFGLIKLLPIPAHLALDLTSAALLWTGPELLHPTDRQSRRLFRGLGLLEVVVPLLTRTSPAEH